MKKINKEALNYFLDTEFLDAHCELNYNSVFSLLIAVMLSAQTTDSSVNKVTPVLFEKYKTIQDLSNALQGDVEDIIKSIGLYKNKSLNIIKTAKIIHEKYDDIVPNNMMELISLPGVGRKTASVVLIEGFNIPALPVDTHILRVSKRLGITNQNDDAYSTEMKLRKMIPEEKLAKAHHQLIIFGRYRCLARNPKCFECSLKQYCNYLK